MKNQELSLKGSQAEGDKRPGLWTWTKGQKQGDKTLGLSMGLGRASHKDLGNE